MFQALMKRLSFIFRDRNPILNEDNCGCSSIEHESSCPQRVDNAIDNPTYNQSRWYDKSSSLEEAVEAILQEEAEFLKAIVFLEDAVEYRSIHHKVEEKSLKLYRLYYSKPAQWGFYFIILVIHILAFFEAPSSLSPSSDVYKRESRNDPVCGITETVEIICLQALLIDALIKCYLIGKKEFFQSKWLIAYIVIIMVSLVDWIVSLAFLCNEVFRVRRLLRPFFLIQNSSVMKKTVNCIKRILPEISSVLLLLFLHLYFFTMFGMLLFPSIGTSNNNSTNSTSNFTEDGVEVEGGSYFKTLDESLISLLILLTTANNPDVMMPAYIQHRLYCIFFIMFSLIGLYCFMNILTAVVYNQFRGYFLSSMQSSFFRRRLGLRASFEVIKNMNNNMHPESKSDKVPATYVKMLVDSAKIPPIKKRIMHLVLEKSAPETFDSQGFQLFFDLLDKDGGSRREPVIIPPHSKYLRILQEAIIHKYFTFFCHLVTFANIISITVELVIEYDRALNSRHALLSSLNLIFIIFYIIEQILKIWAYGKKIYFYYFGHIFDGVITVFLVVIEFFYLLAYGAPFTHTEYHSVLEGSLSVWNLVRLINMLIILKILRIIPQIKIMSIVASTVLDIVRNLRAFGGILVVIFYVFAILGMELFQDKLKFPPLPINGSNVLARNFSCGTFQQLNYWANNFDDFFASIVLLWDLMYVNNWHIFVIAYVDSVGTRWAWIYFILWFLVSVIVCLNLFTALILENFIMKWDRAQSHDMVRSGSFVGWKMDTIQDMFRTMVKEPSESELMIELQSHEYIKF